MRKALVIVKEIRGEKVNDIKKIVKFEAKDYELEEKFFEIYEEVRDELDLYDSDEVFVEEIK